MGTTAPQRRLSAVAAHIHPPLPLPPRAHHGSATPAAAAAADGARGIVDLEFFREHGCVIVPQVVPPEQVAAAVDEIGALLGARERCSNAGRHADRRSSHPITQCIHLSPFLDPEQLQP